MAPHHQPVVYGWSQDFIISPTKARNFLCSLTWIVWLNFTVKLETQYFDHLNVITTYSKYNMAEFHT